MAAIHNRAALTGQKSRAAGELFEKMLENSCKYYSIHGDAEICKTPEPMKPIRKLSGGQFVAVFTKKAQPDYKGTLKGGKAVVFEAKHTDADRILRSAVTAEQEAQFNRHEQLGAECFVMVSFSFQRFFKVPWWLFRDMKDHYCRKYLIPADLKEYECYYINGVLRFLYQ